MERRERRGKVGGTREGGKTESNSLQIFTFEYYSALSLVRFQITNSVQRQLKGCKLIGIHHCPFIVHSTKHSDACGAKNVDAQIRKMQCTCIAHKLCHPDPPNIDDQNPKPPNPELYAMGLTSG